MQSALVSAAVSVASVEVLGSAVVAPSVVSLVSVVGSVGSVVPVVYVGALGVSGVSLGLAWPIGLAYAAIWLAVLGLTRISSLAGMSAAIAAPIAAWASGHAQLTPILAAIAVLVLWLHRGNIARLQAGTEAKLGDGK